MKMKLMKSPFGAPLKGLHLVSKDGQVRYWPVGADIKDTFRPKLTKSVFLAMPAGYYLVSNTLQPFGVPKFAEFVVPLAEREGQWNHIVAARVNGCCFFLFKGPEDYRLMIERMGDGGPLADSRN